MPNLYRVQDHGRDLLGHSMAFHTMPWLENMFFLMHTILVSHYNLPCLFCPSYFATQEASVAPKVSATKQVIQIDGLACSSSPITRACHNLFVLSTQKKNALY
jgi:hypothetical protein